MATSSKAVDEYIDTLPKEVKDLLKTLRKVLKEEIRSAEEVISYGVPCLKVDGKYVVYFSGYKKHVSLYPSSDRMEKSLPAIAKYRTGKGTLQIPLDTPLPLPLIRKIVKFLVKQNEEGTKNY